jgi:alginate O-acetyltransferase complex protein AlgI
MDKIIPYFIGAVFSVSAYWLLIPVKQRNIFLLFCSLLFISTYSIPYALYFLFNCLLVYYLSLFIGRQDGFPAGILRCAIIWLLGNLVFFKICTLQRSLWEALAGAEFMSILFPVGLSYIAFRMIHYLVEVHRGNIRPRGFVDFANYALFFPTFLAGPIERFDNFYRQPQEREKFDPAMFNYGLLRIIIGMLKKAFVADTLIRICVPVFLAPGSFPKTMVIFCVYALAFGVFFDFAAYTDIAIGVSALFGYRIMENFDKPYIQKNIALFWRSWHISLYCWLRDYLFFPFAARRASTFKLYAGIFLTLLASILWHSLAPGFLILGI